MSVRFAVALAALCGACTEPPRIERERFARRAQTDITGMLDERRSHAVRPPDPEICEIGARAYCGGSPMYLPRPRGATGPSEPLYMHCMRASNGHAYWNAAECNTPLVVAFDASPVEFTRAPAAFAIGVSERTEWVSATTPWIGLDRDGSGCIESARELFAGFDALAELDANGDGVVDAEDPAFAELLLWSDRDQDKRCTPNEITPLSSQLSSVPTSFMDRPRSTTSYEGETALLPGGARVVDVHLAELRP